MVPLSPPLSLRRRKQVKSCLKCYADFFILTGAHGWEATMGFALVPQ